MIPTTISTELWETQQAHHKYEESNFPTGTTDPDWATWYAEYLKHHYLEFKKYQIDELRDLLEESAKLQVMDGEMGEVDWCEFATNYIINHP